MVWLTGGATLQAIISFAANLCLVWLLMPEDFGRFAIVLAHLGVTAAVINFHVPLMAIRTPEAELTDERKGILTATLLLHTSVLTVACLAVLWFAGLWSLGSLLLLAGTVMTPWASFEVMLFERDFRYRRISVLETAALSASHATAVLAALAGVGALALFTRLISQMVFILAGLQVLGMRQRLHFRIPTWAQWQMVFRDIRGLYLDGFLSGFFTQVLMLVVGWTTGERATGFFSLALRLATLPHQISHPVASRMVLNYFSNHVPENRKRAQLYMALKTVVPALVLTALVAVVAARPTIRLVYGEVWLDSATLLIGMFGVIIGMPTFELLRSFYISQNRMYALAGWGQSWQFLAIAVAGLAALAWPANAVLIMAIGLSAAYLMASLGLLLGIGRANSTKETDSEETGTEEASTEETDTEETNKTSTPNLANRPHLLDKTHGTEHTDTCETQSV